jgi:gliding motility-associated-like protein
MREVVKRRFFYVLTGLVFILLQPLYAQKEGAVWYFGNHAGLDFSGQYPKPLTNGQTNSSEGVASICDKDGKLLFYTDGQTVYNKNHAIMDNGDNLFGNSSSTQSSIIVPKPGSSTEYYIFTVAQAVSEFNNNYKGLNYSIVEISANAPLGRVTIKNTQLPQTSNILFTEKLAVVKDKDGQSVWIIAHQFGTWAFYTFKLTNSGITLVDTPSAGSFHVIDKADPKNTGATGYMKTSPRGNLMAVAVEGMKVFELFNVYIVNNKLNITWIVTLPAGDSQNPQAKTGEPYGVEFSPSGNFLYGSTRKGGLLYQWDITRLDTLAIKNSVKVLREDPTSPCGALQLALNGKIYLAVDKKPYLGVINNPDEQNRRFMPKGAALFNDEANLKGFSGFGLPNIPSYYFSNDICFTNTCLNDTTIFHLADNLLFSRPPTWYIDGERLPADEETYGLKHVFKNSGQHEIIVEGLNNNNTTINRQRTITIQPLPTLAIKDTTLCGGNLVELYTGNDPFYGITNDAGVYFDSTRTVSGPGKYTVTVTNYEGCSSSNTVTIKSKQTVTVVRDPENSETVCPGQSVKLVASGADEYEWSTAPGVWQGSIIIVNPDHDSIFTVNGRNKEADCWGSASIEIKVFPNHPLELGSSLTPCFGQEIVLRVKDFDRDSVYFNYWELASGETKDSIIVNNDISNLVLKVKDINGCFYDDQIDVIYKAKMNLSIRANADISTPICPGTEVELTATGALSYSWKNLSQTTALIRESPKQSTSYWVIGFDGDCKDSTTILINVFEKHPLNLPDTLKDCEGKTVELKVQDFDQNSYFQNYWIAASGNEPSLNYSTAQEDLILTVKDKLTGCLSTDTTNIIFNPLPVITSVLPIQITCNGSSDGSLEIKVDGNSSSYKYSIDDGQKWSYESVFQNLPEARYRIKIKDDAGCESLSYPQIEISEPDPLNFIIGDVKSPSSLQETDGVIPVSITGGTKPYLIKWTGSTEIIVDSISLDIDADSYSISNLGVDGYTIKVTDVNKCSFELPLTLSASVPNAFSPNGDEENETWNIYILNKKQDCKIQVFDRSGLLVYYLDESAIDLDSEIIKSWDKWWDGTFMNQENRKMPAGTYFYRIQYGPSDKTTRLLGTVTIFR